MKLGYYPGCTLKSKAANLEKAAMASFDALGLPPVSGPASANVAGGRTAGFIQWAPDVAGENAASHFVVFYREQAIDTTMRFLHSAAFGDAAKIERNLTLP